MYMKKTNIPKSLIIDNARTDPVFFFFLRRASLHEFLIFYGGSGGGGRGHAILETKERKKERNVILQ